MIKLLNECDLPKIVEIRESVRDRMKMLESPQWKDEYPGWDDFALDIKNKRLWAIVENDEILGYAALEFITNSNFDKLEPSIKNYGVIHRVCVNPMYSGKGIGAKLINICYNFCIDKGVNGCWIDTHELNIPMIRSIEKNLFKFMGTFYWEDGNIDSKRNAYLKVIGGKK